MGMILRNFFVTIAYRLFNKNVRSLDQGDNDTNFALYNNSGGSTTPYSVGDIRIGFGSAVFCCSSPKSNCCVAMFGNNSTPVTYDDALFTPVSGLTFNELYNTELAYNHETERWEGERKLTINNVTDHDITISELIFGWATGSGTSEIYLAYREVFDAITIPAEESATFIFKYHGCY